MDEARACFLRGAWTIDEPHLAAPYMEKGCQLGDGQSCDTLALGYENGNGVEKSIARALSLRQRACALDYKLGCYSLGQMFAYGIGVERDLQKTLRLYEQACAPGDLFDTAPCEWAADIYANGEAVPRDITKAARLYRLACEGERPTACESLASLKP